MFYFLKEDLDELTALIEGICQKIKEIGKDMGRSCQEGAETYHDNFAHEDGVRQQHMLSTRLRELITVKNNARVVSPELTGGMAGIGRTVTFLDKNTNETQTFKIGSYMTIQDKEENTISYDAPLARILIGAKKGEKKEGIIAGKKKILQILKVE